MIRGFFKYLKESYKVVQTKRSFGLLMRKKSFTRWIVQTWNRLYRFKTQPNKAIVVLTYCLLLSVGVKKTFNRPFQ